jgi:hypothetical protein
LWFPKLSYTFIGMLKYLSIVLLMPVIFIGCGGEDVEDTCPVNYTIDSLHIYSLVGNWKFVGFENISNGNIDPPLCGNVESYISFTDSLHHVTGNAAYMYPYLLKGGALINSLSGSYERVDSFGLHISKTVKTSVNGTEQVEEFEQRYYDLLERVDHFEISNNQLWLLSQDGTESMKFVAD